jgi:OmpA-OmpF porin, OOP family
MSISFTVKASAVALAFVTSLAGAAAQSNPLTSQPGAPVAPPPVAAPPASEAPQTETSDPQQAQTTQRDATEIIRSLAPIVGGNPNAPVRDVDADGGKRRVRVDYSRTIDLTVFFEYDSARLTPQARVQLEPLGRALQSKELMPHRFLLAGHTDVVGDSDYNRMLSLQRAMAVRQHLSETFGIDPQRLVVHGWGYTRLKDSKNPRSAVNRRVEVALIAPSGRQSFWRDAIDPVMVVGHDHPVSVLVDGERTTVISGQGPSTHVTVVPHRNQREVLPGDFWPTPSVSSRLVDPRSRLRSDDLDDFHGSPTPRDPRHISRHFAWDSPLRQSPVSATYDPVTRSWSDGWN